MVYSGMAYDPVLFTYNGCAFCPDCGSRVWHEGAADNPVVSVKGGSLDRPVDLRGAIHIWTERMLPGVVLPEGAVSFPGEPD